ncbi:hypothetical protein [Cupriavidus plantarum]|uniref:hypothetical protein n=1 Tax=Cupriavidus plantarum TaxID=942865 RepID=UPI00339DA57C
MPTAFEARRTKEKTDAEASVFFLMLVAWDGIEPPTQGFSKLACDPKAAPGKASQVVRKRNAA